jgi:hypothetical protein
LWAVVLLTFGRSHYGIASEERRILGRLLDRFRQFETPIIWNAQRATKANCRHVAGWVHAWLAALLRHFRGDAQGKDNPVVYLALRTFGQRPVVCNARRLLFAAHASLEPGDLIAVGCLLKESLRHYLDPKVSKGDWPMPPAID